MENGINENLVVDEAMLRQWESAQAHHTSQSAIATESDDDCDCQDCD